MGAAPVQLLGGLAFPEGPRWFQDKLWFSDLRTRTVTTAGLDGSTEVVLHLDDSPSGIGFLPDATPIVVSMHEKKLLRLVRAGAELHADLRDFPGDFINDMVVDDLGNAYVGSRSSALRAGFPVPVGDDAPDTVVMVRPDGHAEIAADHLVSPNGTAITADGGTLVVAQTYAHSVLAYDRAADGSLSNRRVYAEVGDDYPDGLCLDSEGAVWIGSPYTGTFLRVRQGGEVTDRVPLPGAVACVLGGEDRRVLFLLSVDPSALRAPGDPSPGGPIRDQGGPVTGGHVWTTVVEHPGAGRP
jgi:sugar lactone lactonase YvrE